MPKSPVQADYQIYADQLASLGHGLPLWEPAPLGYDKVNVADVGYVRHGCFHRLFNAALPADHKANRNGVPRKFVPLDLGSGPTTQWRQPRVPRALHTQNINAKGCGIDISASPSWIQAGGGIKFESTGSQGAILLTSNKTYREDVVRVKRLERYILEHHESWLEFASEDDRGIELEDLMLITGYDVTSEYAMAAFSNASHTVGIEFQIGATPVASASVAAWGTWQTTTSVHHNCGPQIRVPPSTVAEQYPLVITTSISLAENEAPSGYNQCLFLRRFQIRKRAGLFPTVIKAAAGPHDLGSGHRRDELAPVLTEGPNVRISELPQERKVIVVSDTPPFRDPLDPVFRYIFANTDASVAILHDTDLIPLLNKPRPRETTEEIQALMQRLAPDIEVGSDGVARMMVPLDNELPLRTQVDLPFYTAMEGFENLAGLVFNPDLQPAVEDLMNIVRTSRGIQEVGEPCEQLVNSYAEMLKRLSPEMNMQRVGMVDAISQLKQRVHEWSTFRSMNSLAQRAVMQKEIEEMQSVLGEDETTPAANPKPKAKRTENASPSMPHSDSLLKHSSDTSLGNGTGSRLRRPRPVLIITLPHTYNEGNLSSPFKEIFSRNSEFCLDGHIRRLGEYAVGFGGLSDVRQGILGNQKVAIKTPRLLKTGSDRSKLIKRLWREYSAWSSVSHLNVLECLGFSYDFSPESDHFPSLISPWMPNGSVDAYLKEHPNTDRLGMLLGVAQGLTYLHDQRPAIVHGDLTPANILISGSGAPCLSGFGLSRVLSDEEINTSTDEAFGALRWMSPELLGSERAGVSVNSDTWAYGMVALEIFFGERPFQNIHRDVSVLLQITKGVVPARPQETKASGIIADAMWSLCEHCWAFQPADRPPMRDVTSKVSECHALRGREEQLGGHPAKSVHTGDSSPTVIPNLPPAIPSELLVPTHPLSGQHVTIFPYRKFYHALLSFGTSGRGKAATSLLPFHGSSASLDMGHPSRTHGNKSKAVRPSTAVGPKVTHLRQDPMIKPSNQISGERIEVLLSPPSMHISGPMDIPTARPSTAESSVLIASSLPSSFVAPVSHAPSRPVLDIAPSEDEFRLFSLNSDFSSTSSIRDDASSTEPVYIKYGSDGTVKAATLPGLVERLVYDSTDFRKDMQFRETFLSSYQAFTNAKEVFDLLIERFEAVSSPSRSAEQRASVRYSVLTVLELWLRGQHAEAKDLPLLDRMQEFAISIQHSTPAPTLASTAQRLAELIDSRVNTLSYPMTPLTPSSSSSSTSSKLTPAVSPPTFALALTMLESDRYRKIIPADCIAWLKGTHESNEISSFIAENNKLSYWVQKSILKPDVQSQRSENVKYFLSVAEECRKLGNFSSTCALFAGLASSFITGLKRTSTLDKPSARIFREVENLMSPDKNFRAYRKALNTFKKPCVPWLRVHLHDVKVIHDSHRTFIAQDGYKGVINFELYHRVHERIRHILSYQELSFRPENLVRHSEIETFIDGQLRSFVIDDNLRDWLEKRAAKLTHDEQLDYDAREQELRAAGFLRAR